MDYFQSLTLDKFLDIIRGFIHEKLFAYTTCVASERVTARVKKVFVLSTISTLFVLISLNLMIPIFFSSWLPK